MLTSKPVRELIEATHAVLSEPLHTLGISHEIPKDLTTALDENTFYFSGFKTHHELVQASQLLKGDDGGFKPFNRFLQDVQKIDNTYNRNYLQAEYNFAVQSTQMAVKWKEWERDGDDYDLQYRTAGDDRVREEHAALDGTTLPPSDPFWDHYLPPNGWNCRCTTVQVRRGKYPQSDPAEALARGQACTSKPKQQIFRFNPGKQEKVFPPKHPYFPKGCGNCQYKQLAYDPTNEQCRACRAIQKFMEDDKKRREENHKEYERLKKDPDYNDVKYDDATGGLKATHKDHNFDKNKGGYEEKVRDIGYRNGHSVRLESEKGKNIGENYTEGLWDSSKFELASCENPSNNNNILKGLKHCASKDETETAVLYFPKGDFLETNVNRAINRYYGLKETLGTGFKEFKSIYAVNGETVYLMR